MKMRKTESSLLFFFLIRLLNLQPPAAVYGVEEEAQPGQAVHPEDLEEDAAVLRKRWWRQWIERQSGVDRSVFQSEPR